MRSHALWMLVIAAVCGPVLAGVQPGGQVTRGARNAEAERERLLKATQLPKKAEEVREKGVPEGEMKEALEAAKAKGVGAGEMADLTDEQSKAIDQHGRIDNFGSFVKSKLNEGLRGRELAAAIRAEHAKRGKGPKSKAEGAKGNDKAGKGAKPAKPEVDKDGSAPKDDKSKKPEKDKAEKAKGKPGGK